MNTTSAPLRSFKPGTRVRILTHKRRGRGINRGVVVTIARVNYIAILDGAGRAKKYHIISDNQMLVVSDTGQIFTVPSGTEAILENR